MNLLSGIPALVRRVDRALTRHALALGLIFSALLAAATAAYNLTVGPLHNLNDIGTWHNRLLFTAMTAAAHALLLALLTLLYRKSALRLALRQLIVTAGLLIAWLAINQKSYAFMQQTLPLVRAMDADGLSAVASLQTNLSAPSLTLLYAVTRGPVYDMYLLKLLSIFCFAALALLAMRAADARAMGWRAETALALCLILPQGFMAAACAGLPGHACVLLTALSLALCLGWLDGRERPIPGALCYGLAIAVSGLALYALPAFALLIWKKRLKPSALAISAAVAVCACLPAIGFGMPATQALCSLLRANFAAPAFASGAPSLLNLFPRAAVEEMPGYVLLSRLPAIDTVTNAQPYYTQAHMEIAMRSVTLLGLALLLGVWALALRDKGASPLRRALALTLGALFVCPGASSAAWLAADMLCVLALLAEPKLRLPACLTLFATMGAGAYPVTGETQLPVFIASALAFAALLMLLNIFPAGEEENADG